MGPAEELRYLVLATQREGNRELARALRPLGLTPAQAEVLVVLGAEAPLSVRAVGARLVCEAGSPSRLVSGLVAAGLVERGGSGEDARLSVLRLTAAGLAALEGIRAAEQPLHDQIERAGTAADLARVANLLRGLVADRPAGRAVELRRTADNVPVPIRRRDDPAPGLAHQVRSPASHEGAPGDAGR